MRALLAAVAAAAVSVAAIGCSNSGGDPQEAAAPSAPRDFFGVSPQALLAEEDLDRMEEGQVGTVRIVIPWAALEPSANGVIDFSTIDPVVLGAAANGVRVLPFIFGTPDWVAEGIDGYSCAPSCGAYAPSSPEALAAWKDFVGEFVDRYGPGGEIWSAHPEVPAEPVRAWQIWNEQNSPTFYMPKVDPGAYLALLGAASETIRERDPGAQIVLGGMFGTPFGGKPPGRSAWWFLRSLYALDGARDSFDGVAAHPYAAHLPKIELQVRVLREEVERADDDASIWITEIGSSSDEGTDPLERGPEGQAEQLRGAFDFFVDQREAWSIETVVWYSWRDVSTDPNQCAWCPGSGLFEEASLVPKPAWDAFVSFTGGS